MSETCKTKRILIIPSSNDLPAILPRIYDGPASLTRLLTEEEVKIHRDVLCKKYNHCLKVAAKWPSFSCLGCPSYGTGAEAKKEQLEEIAASRL